MTNLIFIYSMSHSGSTLLDLMVSGHSNVVGLGEVFAVINEGSKSLIDNEQKICSCGAHLMDCEFWGVVHKRLKDKNLNHEEAYLEVFNIFREVYGEGTIPLDSSKYFPNLQYLHDKVDNIKVLFLVRDVRSFTISQIDKIKKKGNSLSVQKRFLRGNPFPIFLKWYLTNKKMNDFLVEKNMSFLQVGYEELCLRPKIIMNKVCDFLEIEFEEDMIYLGESGSHVVRGNRMRFQKEKRELMYDNRWFRRKEWHLPTVAYPNIMRFNTEMVYSNKLDKVWKK
ncbi:MAG: sulfotransferase [Bacteroidota bacterium]